MVDDHMVAISIAFISSRGYRAIGGGIYGRALWCGKIKSGVEFNGFINRVYPVSKTRSNPVQVFITNRLYGRCMSQQYSLFFIISSISSYDFFWKSNPVTEAVKGGDNS